MAAFEEDFLQTIISVHWGTADLLAISYAYRVDGLGYTAFPFQPIPGLKYDQIHQDVLKLTVAPFRQGYPQENPISDEMLKDLVMFTVDEPLDFSTQLINVRAKPKPPLPGWEFETFNLNGHQDERVQTLFINLSKVRAATNAKTVHISATIPHVTGMVAGPTLDTYGDFQGTFASAGAAIARYKQLASEVIGFRGLTMEPVALGPDRNHFWFVYGTFNCDYSMPQTISMRFSAFTYGKKRNKKEKVKHSATLDQSTGYIPPISNPVSTSEAWIHYEVFGFTQLPVFRQLFEFTVNLKTLKVTHHEVG